MDIHKPKPWHGAREFLKEYVIIVVGVLTALGAEQVVEWAHNRTQVAEAHEVLRQELNTNARSLRFALAEDRCFLTSMDRYVAWAKGGPPAPPIVDSVGFPSTFSSVWEIARVGAVAHMPLKDRLAYANFYALAANHTMLVTSERKDAGILGRYAYLDSLTPREARSLLQDASSFRPFLRIKIRQDGVLLDLARKLGAEVGPMGPDARARLETTCRLAGAPVTE